MTAIQEVAQEIGISSSYLGNIVKNRDKFYKAFYKTKATGDKRQIEAPSKTLKGIQRWILRNKLENTVLSERTHGFIAGRSIKTNARYHVGKKYILAMDIKDFFPSIGIDKVYEVFYQKSRKEDVSLIYARLCTYADRLPQGAPTSPALSNIVFLPVDNRITDQCDRMNLTYSRYADDLTFASNDLDLLKELYSKVKTIINEEGYALNPRKTRYYSGKQKMVVTGLLLNSGQITTGRDRKRRIRAALYNYIARNDDAVEIEKVLGIVAFIRGIEPDYYSRLKNYIYSLKKRCPESKRWQEPP